jgi:hypothetical protein
MMAQISSEINQVTKRRPRLVVYLKTETGPTTEDFANLHDSDIALLERRWGRPIATESELVVFQNHFTWRKEYGTTGKIGEEFISGMAEFMSKPLPEKTRQVVLEFREVLRRAWRGDPAAAHRIEAIAQVSARILVTKNGQFELIIDNLLGMASILFLRGFSTGRLGICANPHCPSPFFVRSRGTQKFCDMPVCMVYSHRISANNYWARHREKAQVKSKKRVKKR